MTYLIPLKARGASSFSTDNFLFSMDRIFVMDNHRLALWCWFQRIKKGERYNLLHIDAHPDLSDSALKHFSHDLWNLSLEDYREAMQRDINTPLFRWDNYLQVFLKKYPEAVGRTFSATHDVGSNLRLDEAIKPYDLLKFASDLFSEKKFINDLNWIVNLDLDYFFSAAPEKVQLFSEEYLEHLSKSLHLGLKTGAISVLTISLSPECCGSWTKAEGMLKYFFDLDLG